MTTSPSRPRPRSVDVRGVACFTLLAFGLAWAVALPLWLSGRGLDTPGAYPLLIAMMFVPSVAVFVVTRWISPDPYRWYTTGVRSRSGVRGWVGFGVLAWLLPVALTLLSLPLGAALGVYPADFTGLSGGRAQLEALSGEALPFPPPVLGAVFVLQVLLLGWFNVIPAFGEEWGWRGYLLPALLPLGRWPALLISGVVWGLWHAPVILLGYNYPLHSPWTGLLLMVVFCVLVGVLLGWLRLRSGSVWPAAIGHAFINAAAGLAVVFAAAGAEPDNAAVGLLGWSGWLLLAASTAPLVLVFGFAPRRRPGAPDADSD